MGSYNSETKIESDTMKRISLFSLLLVMLFLSSASAGEKPNISFYEEESQTRRLAEQMLTGSKIVVRVYSNYQADQRAYKLVGVPLAGLSVNHSAVKEAYPDIDESDIIVIVGRDQLDKTVAAVVDDFQNGLDSLMAGCRRTEASRR